MHFVQGIYDKLLTDKEWWMMIKKDAINRFIFSQKIFAPPPILKIIFPLKEYILAPSGNFFLGFYMLKWGK